MTMLHIDPQAFIDLLPAVRQSPGHTMQCTYDEPADVVYVAFKPEAEATDSELGPDDIVVRYRGDEVIGLTILHASRRTKGREHMKRRNDDDAEIRADNAPHSEVPISDEKADQVAHDSSTIRPPESKRRLGGSALVQRWTELGLIGYRTDITDVEAHSRRLREAAQRRTAR